MNRRDFISLSAAFSAVLAGCKRPKENIIPQVDSVEYQIPGKAIYYSTVYPFKNIAYGITVKTVDGRPVKIEGNPNHPSNIGTSSAHMQVDLFSLYNPARFRKPRIGSVDSNLAETLERVSQEIVKCLQSGKLVYFLHDEHCSPAIGGLAESMMDGNGLIRFSQHVETGNGLIRFLSVPAITSNNQAAANRDTFGINAQLVPDITKADHLLLIGADILGSDKCALYHTTKYAERIKDKAKPKFDLSVIEPTLTLTGAKADTRYNLNPANTDRFISNLFHRLYLKINDKRFQDFDKLLQNYILKGDSAFTFIEEVVEKLYLNKGKSAVSTASNASYFANVVVNIINLMLDSVGDNKIISPKYQLPFSKDNSSEVIDFEKNINTGKVGAVVFLENNMVYHNETLFQKVKANVKPESIISASLYETETSKNSFIDIPLCHQLESWSDSIAISTELSICQPVISPLNSESISIGDLLLNLSKSLLSINNEFLTFYDYLKLKWRIILQNENEWTETLKSGIYNREVENSSKKLILKNINAGFNFEKQLDMEKFIDGIEAANQSNYQVHNIQAIAELGKSINKYPENTIFLHVCPDKKLYDGSFAENIILQELTDSISGLSWSTAGYISEKLAKRLNVQSGDVLEISNHDSKITLPVLVSEVTADNTICTTYGFGRNCKDLHYFGENLFDIISSDNFYKPVKVKKLDIQLPHLEHYKKLNKSYIEQNKLNPEINFERLVAGNFSTKPVNPDFPQRWAMGINLDACTGCGACIAACQIENNIPVVGPEESLKQRGLHWIKLHKFSSNFYKDKTRFIPVMCQHCENAPCETVCPVYATSHSPEGLNEMTYNRCIGSRYCMVNCPYKVRTFNFFDYWKNSEEPLTLMLNPEVTVRSRGVAEKCTFCVQRINRAKYESKDKGFEKVPEGSVTPACAQACPAKAIVFGDMNNPESAVSKQMISGNAYSLLGKLNTKPSVFYTNVKQSDEK